ncbi:MAG: hypothetical protein JWN00_2533 [Actinomycetia bacterium]|nr:hypothetical protein [Actinomycetes bacterium]
MRKVLVVLAILIVGGLIAADRIGVTVAQNEIGKQVAAQYSLPKQPVVNIHGFPFLTQAIGGTYDQIDVNIGEWTQQGITVSQLKIELTGVNAPLGDVARGDSSNITAKTATASAVIPYAVIQQRAPQGITKISANGSDLQIEGKVSGFGLTGPITALVSVKATSKGIVITPQSANGVPLSLIQAPLSFVVPVQNLPVGSRISDIKVTPDGLLVAATTNDVKFSQLPKA